MVTKNDGFSWAFTYDYDNRLTKVDHAGTTVLQNVYDGDGKRIEKTEGDSTVFSYQGLNVLFEKDLNSGVVTKRFYANGLQVAKMVGSTVSYLHEDRLGSIRFVSSSTGTHVFSSNYIPYGPQFGSSGGPDEFSYTGKIYDGSTGFYYFGARFYDPAMGRFITQDSHAGTPQDPMSLNRYIYARDNPLKYVDPNGHDWWNPFTWTPAQAVLVGAVVALTIISAVQLGLDPATDALDLAAVSEAASSFASAATMTGMAMTGMPMVAMTTEDVAPGVDAAVIATLSEMGRHERTLAAQQQLANILGGTTKVDRTYLPPDEAQHYTPFRIYDVKARGPNGDLYRELKFGPDTVTKEEIGKDRYIIGTLHHDVEYDFVPDPTTGEGPSQRDLDTLGYHGIPWKVWGPEFWRGWRS
ncbi:MAG TPA: RHS repeat-associated core domain-containing protein [Nitrososphaerales archaeon]|nr:RHS repeat-associated core domain-containing protein [Nitrososphaerales archaeon]